jgi:MFS transporter, PPP family, 3-phenylpropionic acid transporter
VVVRISEPIAYIVLYSSMYAAFGVSSPFWPKFFETKGLTSQQIGFILAASMLVRLASGPLVGRLADTLGSLRAVLAGCAVLAAGIASTFTLASTFLFLLTIALLQGAVLAPITSIADALAVNVAKPQVAGKPFEYGWIRGTASAAFILGTLAIGQFISRTDLTPIIWMNAVLLAATACATSLVPSPRSKSHLSRSTDLIGVHGLLSISRFRVLLAVAALVYGSHAMHDAFSVIRWSDAGIGTSTISILWSEAVASEVVVFFLVGPALVRQFGARGAATLAATAGLLRWSVVGMTNSVLVLSILQPLHGLTFALLHLACMRMIADLVPVNLSATGQGLYAFASGLVTTALTLLSGTLYARYAGASFFAMAVLCGVAVPIAWFGLTQNNDRVPQS